MDIINPFLWLLLERNPGQVVWTVPPMVEPRRRQIMWIKKKKKKYSSYLLPDTLKLCAIICYCNCCIYKFLTERAERLFFFQRSKRGFVVRADWIALRVAGALSSALIDIVSSWAHFRRSPRDRRSLMLDFAQAFWSDLSHRLIRYCHSIFSLHSGKAGSSTYRCLF